MSKKSMIIVIVMISLIVIITFVITTSNNNITYSVSYSLKDTVIRQNKGSSWESGANGVYNTIYTKEDGTTIGNDYRYIGANPNNYVSFNNDLYQIIGVFDENTHGVEGKQLVKIIRSKLLGGYSWGISNSSLKSGNYSNDSNDWTGLEYNTPASVNVLLNQYFYNKINISDTHGECSEWTYYLRYDNHKTFNCSAIVGNGIEEHLRNYIQTATFYLNGYNSIELTANDFYLCERGLYTNCTSSNNGGGDEKVVTNIALMYPSDYLYATGYNASDTNITGSYQFIGSQNWLFKGQEWLITPKYDTANFVNYISAIGKISSRESFYAHGIRPTFYLKEDVYVTGGTGTFDNPYTLDCDTCSE